MNEIELPLNMEFGKENKNKRIIYKDSIDMENLNDRIRQGGIKLYHEGYSNSIKTPYDFLVDLTDSRIIGTIKKIDFEDSKILVGVNDPASYLILKEYKSLGYKVGYFGLGKISYRNSREECKTKIDSLRILGFELLI